MIANTTSDLEEHLREIDDRLKTLSSQVVRLSDKDPAARELLQEWEITKQCLLICT